MASEHAYFAGRKPATLKYLFRSAGEPRNVRIRVIRVASRRIVASRTRHAAEPGEIHKSVWRGNGRGGGSLGDGRYAFQLSVPGSAPIPAGRFELHGHRFPVSRPHGTRGPIGEFGAPRAGGRVHEGFDVTAPCGTPLLAIRAGRVERRGYDPSLYGNYIQVDARKSNLDYFYAHLLHPADASRGESVKTSARLGKIGLTGNAAGTPCHLHVELRRSGRLLDPEPSLRRWDRYG